MDSREGSLEKLISELDDRSGDGTGGRGGFWAWAEMVLHRNPFPNIWATKLAILVGILPPVDMGLPVSIESWWTQWYKDSLPKPQHKH